NPLILRWLPLTCLLSCVYLLTLASLPFLFFLNDTPPTNLYTLSLHDALPIYLAAEVVAGLRQSRARRAARALSFDARRHGPNPLDRKSTRLNSSHSQISYAVFCLKKKK